VPSFFFTISAMLPYGDVEGRRMPDFRPASTYSFITAASFSLW
jgi:hypothetical protein